MDSRIWIYVIMAVVAVLIILIAILLTKKSGASEGAKADKKPGFRDVLVRDAVDVSTQLYVNEKGEYFPSPDLGARMQTFIVDAGGKSTGRWSLELTDTRTGRKKCTEFTSVLTIGRDPAVKGGERSLAIYDDSSVSKEHCMIRSVNNELVISDLNSRNGTYVNGRRLQSPAQVNTGDRLSIGNSEYVVEIDNRLR